MLLCDTLEEGGGGGQDANNNNKKKSEEEEEEKTRCRYSTRTQHRATEVCNMTRLRGNSRTRRGRLASPSVPYSLVCVYYYLIFFSFSHLFIYLDIIHSRMLLLPLFYLLPSVFVGIHTQQSGAQENPQQYSKSFFLSFLILRATFAENS
jgi:hypothetical protein